MRVHESVPSSYIDAIANDLDVLPDSVRHALRSVRRHRFLDGWFRLEVDGLQANFRHVDFNRDNPSDQALADIYADQALLTAHDGLFGTSSTSQPSLVARMLIALDVRPGMRVLEIGTGTGYNAALLAELCQDPSCVFTIECQRDVSDRARQFLLEEGYGGAHVIVGDGFAGAVEGAPFDRIVATAGCSDVSPHWVRQMAPGGALLVPLQHGLADPLTVLTHDPEHPGSVTGRIVGGAHFMKIQGELEWENPWQTLNKKGFQEPPQYRRPIPDALRLSDPAEHPFRAQSHWGLRFYLALRSQNLWYDNTGYGLANAEGDCLVKLTSRNIEGYGSAVRADCIEGLHTELLARIEEWSALGCPVPTDYEIRLSPRVQCEVPPERPAREWRIERPVHSESIRLP